jgi:hypothetical protein
MVVILEDFQGLLRKSQTNKLSECCAGPFDFVQSYRMHYESENPLTGITLGFFPENLGEISDKHSEKFHQDIMALVKWCQGKWTSSMLADYC